MSEFPKIPKTGVCRTAFLAGSALSDRRDIPGMIPLSLSIKVLCSECVFAIVSSIHVSFRGRSPMKQSCLVFGLLTAISVGMFGCGGEKKLAGTVPVSGTVKLKGAPLAGATVMFAPTTTGVRAASGMTDANGQFKLTTLQAGDGAFPGDFLVTVTKTETVGKQYTPDEANAYYNEHQTQPPAPEIKSVLDAKYGKRRHLRAEGVRQAGRAE